MPLYEYACEACGKRFERIRKFSDPPVDVCPNCSKGPVTKLISAPGFQFKGSGWYVTDYARKSDSGASTAKDSKDSKESKESSASAEAKDKSSTASTESSKDKPASTAESTPKK